MDGKEDKSTIGMLKAKPDIDTELNIAFTHKTRKRAMGITTNATWRPTLIGCSIKLKPIQRIPNLKK